MLKTHVPLKIQSTQPEPAQIIELNTELIELSEEDLEVIVGAGMPDNHNETLIGVADATQSESTQIIELSEEDLEAIAGGIGGGGGGSGCTPDDCGENHNETLIDTQNFTPSQQTESQSQEIQPIELSMEDLGGILGGVQGSYETENGDGVRMNHNEILINIELSEADLAKISGGQLALNHNETITSTAESTQPKPAQIVDLNTELIELSVEDLEAIAGGIDCPPDHCGVNHNEMMVNTKNVVTFTPRSSC